MRRPLTVFSLLLTGLSAGLALHGTPAQAQNRPEFTADQPADPAQMKLQVNIVSGYPDFDRQGAIATGTDRDTKKIQFERQHVVMNDAMMAARIRATSASGGNWVWASRTPEEAIRSFVEFRTVGLDIGASFVVPSAAVGFNVTAFRTRTEKPQGCVVVQASPANVALTGILCDRRGRDLPRDIQERFALAIGYGDVLKPTKTVRTTPPAAAAARPPQETAPAPGGAPGTHLSLAQLRERVRQATVLILSEKVGGGLSIGSGFFVTPTLIITNRHVASDDKIDYTVTNSVLGKSLKAKLIGATSMKSVGDRDIALLQIQGEARAPATLPLADKTGELAEVVAAGFPGIVIQQDQAFRRYLRGDVSNIPGTIFTKGTVSSVQTNSAQVKVILHTAQIHPGNSGGPLVDECGAVVGINTYLIGGQSGQTTGGNLFYAMHGAEIGAFLNGLKVTYVRANSCE